MTKKPPTHYFMRRSCAGFAVGICGSLAPESNVVEDLSAISCKGCRRIIAALIRDHIWLKQQRWFSCFPNRRTCARALHLAQALAKLAAEGNFEIVHARVANEKTLRALENARSPQLQRLCVKVRFGKVMLLLLSPEGHDQ